MAEVAARRVDQMQDPELNFEQAYADYRRLGYSDKWINQRLKSIEVRKELTDEWDRAGVKEGQQYASLTDIITQAWSGKTTRQYKQFNRQKISVKAAKGAPRVLTVNSVVKIGYV